MNRNIMQDREDISQLECLNHSNSVYKPTTVPTLPRRKNRRFDYFRRGSRNENNEDERQLACSEQIARLLFGNLIIFIILYFLFQV